MFNHMQTDFRIASRLKLIWLVGILFVAVSVLLPVAQAGPPTPR